MSRADSRELDRLREAWRAEPARVDLACALYDALAWRELNLEAVDVMREVLTHVPQDTGTHFRLGDRFRVLGRTSDAVHHLQQAADAPIVGIDDWLFRSIALGELGHAAEAEAAARHYLTLRPGHLHGTYQLVGLLLDGQRMAEAAALIGAAMESAGDGAAIFGYHALRFRLHGVPGAEALIARLAQLVPPDGATLLRLAHDAHLTQASHWAVQFAARAVAASNDADARVYHDLLLPHVPSGVDDARWWVERYRNNLDALRTSGLRVSNPLNIFELPPTILLFLYAEEVKALDASSAAAWRALAPDVAFTAPHCRTWRDRPVGRRLRVGFLTTPRYPLIWGVAAELDRDRFDPVLLYDASQGVPDAAAWGRAVERHVPLPQDIAAAREAVANEELDVLVCTPFRPLFYFMSFARLAPVQTILCEPAFTDGIDAVDHYISWTPAEPSDLDAHYTTPVALMERPPYWVERDHCRPDASTRADFDLPHDARWYVCPSTPLKIHPAFDRMLAALLAADPQGIVVFLRSGWHQTREVERRLRGVLGASADRLHLLPMLPAERCHALLTLADAVLDTWPIGGMSSSLAGILVAAPTVTLPTDVPYGRWLAAMYEWIGVTDLIAQDEADYVRLAVRLAKEPEWRRDIARRLAARCGMLVEDRLAMRELERFLDAAVAAAHRGDPHRDWIGGEFVDRLAHVASPVPVRTTT